MPTVNKSSRKTTSPTGISGAVAYHELNALLRTVRSVSQHEDALCELLHEMRDLPTFSTLHAQELGEILSRMPVEDLHADYDVVKTMASLPAPPVKRRSTKSTAAKAKKSVRKPVVTKKQVLKSAKKAGRRISK